MIEVAYLVLAVKIFLIVLNNEDNNVNLLFSQRRHPKAVPIPAVIHRSNLASKDKEKRRQSAQLVSGPIGEAFRLAAVKEAFRLAKVKKAFRLALQYSGAGRTLFSPSGVAASLVICGGGGWRRWTRRSGKPCSADTRSAGGWTGSHPLSPGCTRRPASSPRELPHRSIALHCRRRLKIRRKKGRVRGGGGGMSFAATCWQRELCFFDLEMVFLPQVAAVSPRLRRALQKYLVWALCRRGMDGTSSGLIAEEEWMELQKRIRIYELGSLPPFLLVFAPSYLDFDLVLVDSVFSKRRGGELGNVVDEHGTSGVRRTRLSTSLRPPPPSSTSADHQARRHAAWRKQSPARAGVLQRQSERFYDLRQSERFANRTAYELG